jgi:glucose-6-phosphate 1-dehydrogenase
VRGQYEGYRKEAGVAADSEVETFAAIRTEVDSWRWAGVPFLIRAGKSLPVTATEVLVKLRQPPLSKAEPGSNYFRFRLSPDLELTMGARVKHVGPGMRSVPAELAAVDLEHSGELDAYERLLTDAMNGESMLFVRQDAVEAAWSIVEPVLGNSAPLHTYAAGTWGPPEADRLAADIGGWSNPKGAS